MKVLIKKEFGSIVPYSEKDRLALDKIADGAVYEIDIKNSDMRTIKQNSAIHKWCSMIADSLNDSGQYVSATLKAESVWTMGKVKENIFKEVVKSIYDKDSTTKLNKDELNNVIDTIVLAFSTKGITVPPFPKKEIQ